MLSRFDCQQSQGFLYGRPQATALHAEKTLTGTYRLALIRKRPSVGWGPLCPPNEAWPPAIAVLLIGTNPTVDDDR